MRTRQVMAGAAIAALLLACSGSRQAVDGSGVEGNGQEVGDDSTLLPEALQPDGALEELTPDAQVQPDGVADVLPDAAEDTSPDQGADAPDDLLDIVPPCCHSNDECGDNGYCVAPNLGAGGVCHYDLLPDGSCFEDADCGDYGMCIGATLCSCDMNCVSVAGTCDNPFYNCCFLDDHCPEGMVCASSPLGGGGPGACELPLTEPGSCWDDQDCQPGASCIGTSICPCDAQCDMIDMPGQCKPGVAADCCTQDSECGYVHECVLFPEYLGMQFGACKDVPQDGSCWMHTDCADDEVCLGAVPCPCGYTGEGDGCDIPGKCHSKTQYGCCTNDMDCQKLCDDDEICDLVCGVGNTCVPTLKEGECWKHDDCGLKEACVGVTMCGCGLLCALPTAPGECQPLVVDCCLADEDCGVGQECAGGIGGLWGNAGVCKPPAYTLCSEDAMCCWDDDDCGFDEVCTGEYLCPCDADCDAEDQPGKCLALP